MIVGHPARHRGGQALPPIVLAQLDALSAVVGDLLKR